MNFKTDKENISCDDIAFLYEIIMNIIFWPQTIEYLS
jgi:hypothetical protein